MPFNSHEYAIYDTDPHLSSSLHAELSAHPSEAFRRVPRFDFAFANLRSQVLHSKGFGNHGFMIRPGLSVKSDVPLAQLWASHPARCTPSHSFQLGMVDATSSD